MDRLDTFRLYVRIVDRGSFSAAAKEAGIGQSAASKRIAGLEASLGAQLLRRSSRGLSPTEAGRAFYDGCVRLLDDLSALEADTKRGHGEPSGLLRVAIAPVFGRLYVVPHLSEFFDLYPAVRIELVASDWHVDLVEENIDVAIRHGALSDSSLTARKLAETPFVTVASRSYLDRHGSPAKPSELDGHSCLAFNGSGEVRPWTFVGRNGSTITHYPDGCFRTNDGAQLRAAILAGLGIAFVPAWLIGPELATGVLKPLSSGFEARETEISAVYSSKRGSSGKVRAFLDFLAAKLAIDLPKM